MTFTEFIFLFFIALTIIPALFILITKNVLYAAFSMLLTFLGVAGLYVFAHADFLAVTQIMIYVGGILILILFGIMLTNRIVGEQYVISRSTNLFVGLFLGMGIFAILVTGIIKANFSLVLSLTGRKQTVFTDTTVQKVGENLMTTFALPFEVSALLLLAALLGAAFVAGQIVKKKQKS